MTPKITDARINYLERLMALKADMKAKLQKKKDEIKEMRAAMESGGTPDLVLSSAAAALSIRGVGPSVWATKVEEVETLRLAVQRVEEMYAGVEEELNRPGATDAARTQELKRLKARKDDLMNRLQKKKDQVREIHDAMEREGTSDLVLSSATAALTNRDMAGSSGSVTDDSEEILDLAMERVDQMYAAEEEELNRLKEIMGTES